MSSKLRIETRVRPLKGYLADFEKTAFQIPSFQRDYLWTQDDIKELFDSIKNSYPIGSILLWMPAENHTEWISQENQFIGPYKLKKDGGHEPNYILDGFQRLSTLFGCLTNPYKHNTDNLEIYIENWADRFNLHYDLEEEQFLFLRKGSNGQAFQVPVYIFMNSIDFRQYARKEFEKIEDEEKIELYYDRADEMGQILNSYQLASVDIKHATIEEAVEIFRRVNEKGLQISKDWIVSALTNRGDFRLGSEIDNLVYELRQYNFENLKRDIVFQCVQNSFGKYYYDVKIEDLVKRADFVNQTRSTLNGIKSAVKFLYNHAFILNSKLLPYPGQLIFLSYFFSKNDYDSLGEEKKKELIKWFWFTSYTNYFSIYSIKNLRLAFEQFTDFANDINDDPTYLDDGKNPFSTQPFPTKVFMGSVRAKSCVLFMLQHYMSRQPHSFQQSEFKSFEIGHLLYDIEEYNCTENFIPIITANSSENSKDQSIILKNRKAKEIKELLGQPSPALFINNSFLAAYKNDQIKMALEIRKSLIMEAEKGFVETLGITYE